MTKLDKFQQIIQKLTKNDRNSDFDQILTENDNNLQNSILEVCSILERIVQELNDEENEFYVQTLNEIKEIQ